MSPPFALSEQWNRHAPRRAFERNLVLSDEGLQLGKTILAYWHKNALMLEEDRVLALLPVACEHHVSYSVINSIRNAEKSWQRGDKTTALIHLALTGVQGVDLEKSQRLFAAEWGYNRGVTPAQLLKFAGLRKDDDDDDSEDDDDSGDNDDEGSGADNGRYNPDEPRIPAGQPGGGQWTTGGASAAVANAVAVATDAGRQAELSTGEEEKANSDPIGGLILPAAGAAAVVEAMGTETFAALTARAQNLVVSAMATVTAMGNSATEKAQELYDVVQGAVSDWLEDNAPAVNNGNGTTEDALERELGTDMTSGQFRQGEADTGKLLQSQVGPLIRSSDNAYEWVDAQGITYDAVGPAPAQFVNIDFFNGAIDGHLLKQGLDKVVVNIQNFTSAQQAEVEAHISGLSAENKARIILFK